ncbi:MAG: disulfide bond formation protein B [Actinomycetota bacterium]
MDVRPFSLFFAMLTVAADLFVVGAVVLALAGRWSGAAAEVARKTRAWIAPAALPFAWLVAVTATAGSLFYSEVAGYVPCRLCWYQRIGIYPLVLILGIAALKRDTGIRRYAVPLTLATAAISAYHYQLQRFPGQGRLSCAAEAPCTITWVWQFHYISIPFMALSASALIATLLVIARPPNDIPVLPGDAEQEARRKETVRA